MADKSLRRRLHGEHEAVAYHRRGASPYPRTAFLPIWQAGPHSPTMAPGGVDLWRGWLDVDPSTTERLYRTLSDDEAHRAERYVRRIDRDRFVVARGLLRAILARYVRVEPRQLRFAYSPRGKPHLVPVPGRRTPQFSVSHSHGLALYAISAADLVGVDVERVAADFPAQDVASRFFSEGELALLNACAANERQKAFFSLWTGKEAYAKARDVDISESHLGLDAASDLLSAPASPGFARAGATWWFQSAEPAPSYVGTLAVTGTIARVNYWSYDTGQPEVGGWT